MTISVDYYIWNKDKTKILYKGERIFEEKDLEHIVEQELKNDELPMPINLKTKEFKIEASVDYVKT